MLHSLAPSCLHINSLSLSLSRSQQGETEKLFLSLAPKHFCQAHALGNELGYIMIFYMNRCVKYTFISPSSAHQGMSLLNRMACKEVSTL
jgi:hypothetical protein